MIESRDILQLQQKEINEILEKMINQKVRTIGRASGMLWLGLGEEIDYVDYKGRTTKKSEYALHLQCPWRIKNTESCIVVASYDMYEPNSTTKWSEDFDWDIQGNNLYDEKVKNWFEEQDRSVIAYELKTNLDLAVTFDDGNSLEIFINTTADVECWRFFSFRSKNDVVVSGVNVHVGTEKVYVVADPHSYCGTERLCSIN